VAGAGLAACSDEPTSAPVVPRLSGINAVYNLPACNTTALKDAVRAYADVSGNDSIFTYIRNIDTDAYNQGMNGLARIAQIRASGPKKTGAGADQAAAAVTAFLACMPIGAVQDDSFPQHLKSALSAGGMFEVPTTASTASVFSRGEAANTKYWVAKPADGANWGSLASSSPGGLRYVVFGYEINGETGFDFNVLPRLGSTAPDPNMPSEFLSSLIIGACGTFDGAVRVLHEQDVLFDLHMLTICQGPSGPGMASLSSGFGSDFAMFVRRGLSVFSPQAAYAFGGGVGGAVSELSPANLPTVAPKLEYAPQPATNKAVSDPLGIKVRVYTGASWATGNALNNASVTLTVTGNSGKDAILLNTTTGESCFQFTRTTENGVANFSDIAVTKSGGYTLTAESTWDKLPASATLSNLFNVKNKKIGPLSKCQL
jgi:hypothetical protein